MASVRWERLGSLLMLAVGIYLIIRAFRGKEFFLAGIGGTRSYKPLPNWIGRPLMFLFGVGAIILGVGSWFQK